jgi:hypothetical protein
MEMSFDGIVAAENNEAAEETATQEQSYCATRYKRSQIHKT